ncbi:hypothetical protein E3N88_06915 [Mikania micrantha]|uniref:Uncharacterized protein n=1 Tax=Mikania micrantha TaxID=192012 RepID=A0A5N6PSY1_9ASTR|nr:hypothetical protein E3N88_06915 [Mikania micrantha]
MIGVAHHWFTALTQIWESITWPEFQSELLQRFSGFAIPTPSEQLDLTHDSLLDVVDGKNEASVSSTVSPAPFSYSIRYGLLLNDGLSKVAQPQPYSTFSFPPAEKGFQSRLLLGNDQSNNRKGESLLVEADNSPTLVESWMKFTDTEHSLLAYRNDKGESLNASYYHIVNPSTNTSVGAEVNHNFSTNENTITVGTQHALDPLTTVKARIDNLGKANALIQHEWRPKSLVTISGEVDTKAVDKSAKFGLALALNP